MSIAHLAQKTLLAALAVALGGSLCGMPTVAQATDGEDVALDAQADALPAKFDLRERGVVTPVKRQNPWNTCWSFGAIAAAESSILSETLQTTYANTPLDLSERHLIYFALNPVNEQQAGEQHGEGLYHLGNENNPNAAYRTTNPIVSATLFSSGVGPVYEEHHPYQNKEGMTEFEYMKKYPDQWKAHVKQEVEANGKTLAQLIAENAANPNYPKSEAEYLQNSWNGYIRTVEEADNYTEYLDWSVPDSDRNLTAGFTLIDGNKLPEYVVRDKDGRWTETSTYAIDATKRELRKGRGVAVAFCADSSSPSQTITQGKYIELNHWAHYTYDNARANHMVTIVGWDDAYSRDNFLSGTDASGNQKRPPADGAWIVKNSWGSQTDAVTNKNGRPITKGAWGIKDSSGKSTGYFYLSYYDKSLSDPESFRFGKDLATDTYFTVYQHDFLPATDGFYFATGSSRISTANIFAVGDDLDEDEVLTSVGVRTYAENTTVEIEVYLLEPGVTNPEDGTKLSSFKSTFEYGGFHRVSLPQAVTIPKAKGTRFSVVTTGYVTKSDGSLNYGLAANKADSEAYARRQMEKSSSPRVYGKSVINEGESFLYWKDGWYDWRACIDNDLNISGLAKAKTKEDVAQEKAALQQQADEVAGLLAAQDDKGAADELVAQADASRYPKAIEKGATVIDNFTIKAYTLPASAATTEKVKSDQAPVGEAFSEEFSKKNAGAVVGDTIANWPEQGFTDGEWNDGWEEQDVEGVEDPGLPGDSKDYYDEDWNGDVPEEYVEGDGQPVAKPEVPTPAPKAPTDNAPTNNAPNATPPATNQPPATPATSTDSQASTVVQTQRQVLPATSSAKTLPATGDQTPALFALVAAGSCALALGRRR